MPNEQSVCDWRGDAVGSTGVRVGGSPRARVVPAEGSAGQIPGGWIGRSARQVWKPRGREQSCLVRRLTEHLGRLAPGRSAPGRARGERAVALADLSAKIAHKQLGQKTQGEGGHQTAEATAAAASQQASRCNRRNARARVAQRKASLKQEQVTRRRQQAQEQAQKRERHLRAREKHEQAREQRHLWHEKIKQERTARRSSQAFNSSSASYRILPSHQSLTELAEPP